MITEQQIKNVSNLSKDDLKIILDICIEQLGVCDISESCYALGVQRSRIYQLMNDRNTMAIGKHKFLMLNVF